MMKHLKLFESFQVNEKKDEANISFKKAKKRPVNEGAKEDNKAVEDRLQKLFDKLVPSQGKAETMEGEMVRAVMRVWYRYFNDGDYFFRGYGKETAGPSVTWLKNESPLKKEMKTIWSQAQKNALKSDHPDEFDDEKDGYLKGIVAAAKAVCDYVEAKKEGEYTKNDAADSR